MNKELTKIKKYQELIMKYEFAQKILEAELEILIKEYVFKNNHNPIEHTKSRIKEIDSALKKLHDKGFSETPNNIKKHVHDMIGIRIVCPFLDDVYKIIKIIKKSKKFKILEVDDYIKKPKNSGYHSYHLNILVPIHLEKKIEYMEAEIQIRTTAMDFWASIDHKLRYKISSKLPEQVEEEMITCSNDIRQLDLKMQNLLELVEKYKD